MSPYSRVMQLLYELKQKGVLDFLFVNRNSSQKEKGQNPAESVLVARAEKGVFGLKQSVPERGLDVQVYNDSPDLDWENAWNPPGDRGRPNHGCSGARLCQL